MIKESDVSQGDPVNVPTKEPLLPHEVKRIAKKGQKKVNAELKQKAKRAGKSRFKDQKHVDLMSFSAGAELQFVEGVRKLIEKEASGQVPINVVYQEMAYELDVSPQTAKRYLIKHSARRAEFRVFGPAVMLNPKYRPDEEGDDDDDE